MLFEYIAIGVMIAVATLIAFIAIGLGELFILFDIEVVFFLPWAIAFRQLGLFGLIEMVVFIVILLIGYVYAWKKGALEWE